MKDIDGLGFGNGATKSHESAKDLGNTGPAK